MAIDEQPSVVPLSKRERQKIYENVATIRLNNSEKYLSICSILTARASHRRNLQYAIAKYRLARNLYQLLREEKDPSFLPEHINLPLPFQVQVRLASSVVILYSIIEGLNLHIKASHKRPSTVNHQWNSTVRNDLINRLVKSNININDGQPWDVRGTVTKIEKYGRRKPFTVLEVPNWASGNLVRDRIIDICDAILIASNIRSKVAAHSSTKELASLNPYMVENIAFLVRRLLLSRLRSWPINWNALG
jgi:hypothetical protein